MLVLVMGVREMPVPVGQRLMPVRVAVHAAGIERRIARSVIMSVMRIVAVPVVVGQGLVTMLMLMRFAEMEIEAERHEKGRGEEEQGR